MKKSRSFGRICSRGLWIACGLLLFLVSNSSFSTALAQGSLTPSGPPAPTMKTLDQVEPRTPIDTTNTPGDATNLFRITASGSYYLTGSVTGVSGKNGISIEANNVTIDLRGFTLGGVSGSLDGILLAPGSSRLTVRNGTISGWGGDGVDEAENGASDGIYENIRTTGNAADGFRLGGKCVIKSCKLEHNSGSGVSVGGGRATISGCTASDNALMGFYFGAGSILDSVAHSNGGSGIESFDEPVLMKNCVAFENGEAGFRSGGGGKMSDCIARQNSFAGIDCGYYATVTNCTVKNNPLGIFAGGSCRLAGNMGEGNGDGIFTYDERNVIEGNQLLNGGTGILAVELSTHNLIIKNTVGNNTTNYDISADNRYGPIVNLTAGGSPAVSGDSGADTTTTTHPWANFAY